MESNEIPLAGLRIIELASVLAGPSIGMSLAELGAEVIKIENPTTEGDVTRSWRLPRESGQGDISAYFACANWGKRSLAVNLRTREGRQIIHELTQCADIVLASYKPGDAERLKVDYAALSAINPAIIYAHITGYGTENPRAGYDAIIQAESGFTYMNGESGGGPTKMPVALMDLLAAHQAKEGILLALLARARNGRGSYVSVSLLQAAAASLANQATNWLVGGEIPQPMGSDHPNIVPYGSIFTTRDNRKVVLAIGNDKQFGKLCAILDIPEVAKDPDFSTNPARVQRRSLLFSLLQDRICKREQVELLHELHTEAVPAGAVNNMSEVCELPEVAPLLLKGETSDGVKLRAIRSVAVGLGASFRTDVSAPPHYGEHTRPILRELLRYSDEEIQDLHERKCIYARQ